MSDSLVALQDTTEVSLFRPFKYGHTVPTDEEAADVLNDPGPQLTKEIHLPQDEIVSQLALLLDESMACSSQPVVADSAPSMASWLSDGQADAPAAPGPQAVMGEAGLILHRGDRRRLAGHQYPDLEEEDTGSSDKEN